MESSLQNPVFICNDFLVKSFLGVASDIEEHILITCKAVVKQYNVLDRRPVRTWTTKSWHPFTATAVCDPDSQNIIAVINENSIWRWSHDAEDIDKAKHFNFETPIHQLLVGSGKVFIVFKTGEVGELSSSIATRRESRPGFLQKNDHISHVQLIEGGVIIVANNGNTTRLYKLQLDDRGASFNEGNDLAVKDATLTGICALASSPSSKLITLWSNGDLYSMDLKSTPLQYLPGKKHATETKIAASKPTKILELSPSHIAIVGMAEGDEGGLIVLRDTTYRISVNTRKLKMYQNPPMAYTIPEGIVVLDGGSLTLVPTFIEESNLASVFASKISQKGEFAAEDCRSWNISAGNPLLDDAHGTVYTKRSSELGQIIRDLEMDGLTESILVSHLIKHLLERKNLRLLKEAVDVFTDIPESILVDVLCHYLGRNDTDFRGICNCPPFETKLVIEDSEPEEITCPFSYEKAHFVNGVLSKQITDMHLLTCLPRINFQGVLSLIQYLHFLIAGEQLLFPIDESHVPSLDQVSLWMCLLLDANYHHLVMTSQDSIHKLLESCLAHVGKAQNSLLDMMQIESMANCISEGKMVFKKKDSGLYSIQLLTIE